MNIVKRVCYKIERFFFYNHINPLLTLWINLRYFSLKSALKFPIYIYGWPKIICNGKIIINGKIKKGLIHINKTFPWAPDNETIKSSFLNQGIIEFAGTAYIYTGAKIEINNGGYLFIGNNVKLCKNINLCCYNEIKIGDNTMIAHRSQIYDTSFHFILDIKDDSIKNNYYSIKIDNDCWICNNSTISGNIKLPRGTIVSSNSLVNKTPENLPPYTMIGGVPSKILRYDMKRILDEETEIELSKYFKHTCAPNISFSHLKELLEEINE